MSVRPISQSQQNSRVWRNLVDDHFARIDLALGEAARLEGQGMERARLAVTEMARLSLDTITFWSRLSSEWRRVSLDAARRTADLMIPKG
jgi:hypothetical protein